MYEYPEKCGNVERIMFYINMELIIGSDVLELIYLSECLVFVCVTNIILVICNHLLFAMYYRNAFFTSQALALLTVGIQRLSISRRGNWFLFRGKRKQMMRICFESLL